ncbi:hypothetical protein CEXT_251291 [Caerostris extrusa]|uniref:Uncharacterized protein n=1 Tax=Caerostris extrusa TaxID=172846 RepID=A0AAV4QDR7_CAEEX|nr:hypothetical protein CEXT_251291 [Caerostris extrusa]
MASACNPSDVWEIRSCRSGGKQLIHSEFSAHIETNWLINVVHEKLPCLILWSGPGIKKDPIKPADISGREEPARSATGRSTLFRLQLYRVRGTGRLPGHGRSDLLQHLSQPADVPPSRLVQTMDEAQVRDSLPQPTAACRPTLPHHPPHSQYLRLNRSQSFMTLFKEITFKRLLCQLFIR